MSCRLNTFVRRLRIEAQLAHTKMFTTGSQAAWAAKKYHGHRILPPSILSELDTQAANINTYLVYIKQLLD